MDYPMIKKIFSLILFSSLFINPLAKICPKSEKISYRIKDGDTLSEIAQKYNVRVGDIRKWNLLQTGTRIFSGKKIIIYTKSGPVSYSFSPYSPPHTFYTPVKRGKIIKHFNPFGDSRNLGLMYRIPPRTMVKSSASGKVIKVDYLRGYGHYVMIDHGKGWISMYSNLSRVEVRAGNRIGEKENIGRGEEKLFFLISYKGEPLDPLSLGLKRS